MSSYSRAERLYIWLSAALEGSAHTANMLLNNCENIEELYEYVRKDAGVISEFASPGTIGKLSDCANDEYTERIIENMERCGVYALTFVSREYPELLKTIDDPPLVLYCRGKRPGGQLKLPFAIIGARKCTEYGERVAEQFGMELAECGMTIVSGLAYGCDAFAARGALKAKNDPPLPTVAVLGQGVCVKKNDNTQYIMDAIIERGIVMSELLPHTRPTKASYPQRNRIISGMSEGVLVVEAAEKSGTSITANYALEQGRVMFAVPGRITDRMSAGTNRMLSNGMAQAAYSVENILFSFGLESGDMCKLYDNKRELERNSAIERLDETGKMLLKYLVHGDKNIDDLAEMAGLKVETVNLYLTEMEISGLIKQLPGRVYAVL